MVTPLAWNEKFKAFRALGFGVAAVSNDPVAAVAGFTGDSGIEFPVLSDPKSKMIRAFDLLDPRFPPATNWHGLALSMIVVVDGKGVVQRRFSDPNHRNIADAKTVFGLLR